MAYEGGASNDGYSQEDIDRLTGADIRLEWDDLDINEQIDIILDDPNLPHWYEPRCLTTFTYVRRDPRQWGKVKARYQALKGFPPDLERAVDMQLKLDVGETATPEQAVDPYAPPPSAEAPPLPEGAFLHPELGEGASPWLDAYVKHSMKWSPRGARGFHVATGLWVLSTIAARRIVVHLGQPVYPSLFMALVAGSTVYAKSTTVAIGTSGVKQAGCGHLLASARSTPQALLRRMSGVVKDGYSDMPPLLQEQEVARVAFAAQRGWYYPEWGGMLTYMNRTESPISEFHAMLRWLDDGEEDFESDTISRGVERVERPYLALLTSATPHDLAPFLRPGSPWWHDGFWPRFALVTPMSDETPSRAPQPPGKASLPPDLLTPLRSWYHRLGVPKASIEQCLDAKGKPTGLWRATVEPVSPRPMAMAPGVMEAYRTYNDALLGMVIKGEVKDDLSACYGRFHMKALRVAMLLASLQGLDAIEMRHWAYAQSVAETWRAMLHAIVSTAGSDAEATREERLETKLETFLYRHGAMTARTLGRIIKGYSQREINTALQAMVQAGRIIDAATARSRQYLLPGHPDGVKEDTRLHETPF
jgi:hypothetical protein